MNHLEEMKAACKTLEYCTFHGEGFEAESTILNGAPWLVEMVERQGEALRSLYDEQNGPPLLNREAQWQAAMDEALALLAELESKP